MGEGQLLNAGCHFSDILLAFFAALAENNPEGVVDFSQLLGSSPELIFHRAARRNLVPEACIQLFEGSRAASNSFFQLLIGFESYFLVNFTVLDVGMNAYRPGSSAIRISFEYTAGSLNPAPGSIFAPD